MLTAIMIFIFKSALFLALLCMCLIVIIIGSIIVLPLILLALVTIAMAILSPLGLIAQILEWKNLKEAENNKDEEKKITN